MKPQNTVPFLVVLVAAMGCGQNKLQPYLAPIPAPLPVESALKSLTGQYRLLDIDGDSVENGTLEVVESEAGVGVVYGATLSGTTYGRRVLTPKAATEISVQDGRVHQKHEISAEEKITLDYEKSDSTLVVEVIECSPGMCLTTVLGAEAL